MNIKRKSSRAGTPIKITPKRESTAGHGRISRLLHAKLAEAYRKDISDAESYNTRVKRRYLLVLFGDVLCESSRKHKLGRSKQEHF